MATQATNGHNGSNGSNGSFFRSLLTPTGRGPAGKRAWGVDVLTDWVPFFTAAKVRGECDLQDDVLGAPIRLVKTPDGEVRFSKSGRPVTRVHKDLNALVTTARENFVASMRAHTAITREEMPEQYNAQVLANFMAGTPILEQDEADLAKAVEALHHALAEAERLAADAKAALELIAEHDAASDEAAKLRKAEQAAKVKASRAKRNSQEPQPVPEPSPEPTRELVAA